MKPIELVDVGIRIRTTVEGVNFYAYAPDGSGPCLATSPEENFLEREAEKVIMDLSNSLIEE